MTINLNPETKEFLNLADLVENPSVKINLLELAIEQYKEMRDRKTKLGEENENIEKDVNDTKQKLKSADQLVQIYNRLLLEVKKFGDLSRDKTIDQKVRTIKQNRINRIMHALKVMKSNVSEKFQNYLKRNGRGNLVAFPLLLPIILIIPITIFVYLVTLNIDVIYVGFVAMLTNLFLFLLINIFKTKNPVKIENPLGIDYNNINNQSYEELISKLNQSKEDTFLVNAAWVNALRAEARKVYEAINSRLDGYNYKDIMEVIATKEQKIVNNNADINNILDTMISAEEYLKLRRELDILKIEIESDASRKVSIENEDKELIIKGITSVNNPTQNYLKSFFDYISKQYIIKYV